MTYQNIVTKNSLKPFCIIANSVFWRNKNYSIEYYHNDNTGIPSIVVVIGELKTDWPIQYNNGNIAYDNPFQIPAYVKKQVEKAFKNLNENLQKNN